MGINLGKRRGRSRESSVLDVFHNSRIYGVPGTIGAMVMTGISWTIRPSKEDRFYAVGATNPLVERLADLICAARTTGPAA